MARTYKARSKGISETPKDRSNRTRSGRERERTPAVSLSLSLSPLSRRATVETYSNRVLEKGPIRTGDARSLPVLSFGKRGVFFFQLEKKRGTSALSKTKVLFRSRAYAYVSKSRSLAGAQECAGAETRRPRARASRVRERERERAAALSSACVPLSEARAGVRGAAAERGHLGRGFHIKKKRAPGVGSLSRHCADTLSRDRTVCRASLLDL